MKRKYYIKIVVFFLIGLVFCQTSFCAVTYGKQSLYFDQKGQCTQENKISFVVGQSSYFVNGEKKKLPAAMGQSFIDRNGRTMLPLMATAQILGETGITAKWDDSLKTATLYYEGFLENPEIKVTVGKKQFWSRRQGQREMDTEAVIVNGRVYLPLRTILNALGVQNDKIKWDSKKREVQIDRTLYVNTNKIIILKENTTTKQWEQITITDSTQIKKIQSFFTEKEIFQNFENKNSENCTRFIDFNNGTIVGIGETNYGYIGNGIHKKGDENLPDGLSNYINSLFLQSSANKSEVSQAVLEYKLDDNDYGGVYIDDTIFCIMTINKEKVKSVVGQLDIADKVRYENATYSKKQLMNAYNEIWEKKEQLNLYSARIDIPSNQVIVNTEKISDQLLDFIASIDDSKCITIVEKTKH